MRKQDRTIRTLSFVPEVRETTVRRLVSVLVGLTGLLFVLGLVAMLPAVNRLLSALAIPPVKLLVALATLLVVAALVILAPIVQVLVEQSLDGPDDVVENAAASAMYLVGFAAVVIAYRGFAGAVTPLFNAFGIGGVYHLAFLATGLLVLTMLVRRLYRCWEPVTDLLTSYVTDAVGTDHPELSSTEY
jgi:hypothetical protein